MLDIIIFLNALILIYYLSLLSWYTLILLFSFPEIIKMHYEVKYGRVDKIMQKCTIPITAIIAVFNEKERVFNAIYSILNNNYKHVKIIIVNDGSTDNTLDLLINEFKLNIIPPVINCKLHTSKLRNYYQSSKYANLYLIDKEHGKYNNAADSHNMSLNAVTTPVVMTVDSDTVLEPDAIENILYDFLSNTHCVAIGGSIYLLNENEVVKGKLLTRKIPRKFITVFQCIEYLRSFSYGRAGLNLLSGALCYPGAFTLFETRAIKEFGGFDYTNFSFDAEITLNFHHKMRNRHYPTFLRFSPNAISWTVVPDSLRAYWRQRDIWQRGMLLSVFRHIGMLLNPRYGVVGLISFPAYILYEVFGPVIEFLAYILLIINVWFGIISFSDIGWLMFWAWGALMILTISSFYLSLITTNIFRNFSDIVRSIVVVTFEMLGFRQFKSACSAFGTLHFIWNRLRKKAC